MVYVLTVVSIGVGRTLYLFLFPFYIGIFVHISHFTNVICADIHIFVTYSAEQFSFLSLRAGLHFARAGFGNFFRGYFSVFKGKIAGCQTIENGKRDPKKP